MNLIPFSEPQSPPFLDCNAWAFEGPCSVSACSESMGFLDKMFMARLFDSTIVLSIREALAKKMALLFCAERHNQHLLPMLSSVVEEHRLIAAILLGFKDNLAVFPALKARLYDSSTKVRSGAIIGISNLRGGKQDGLLAKTIITLLTVESDREVIRTALRSLKYFFHPEAAPIFISFLGYPDDDVKLACLAGLFFVCNRSYLAQVSPLFLSENSHIRKKALELFEKYGCLADITMISSLTKDYNSIVAKAAKRAIQTIRLVNG